MKYVLQQNTTAPMYKSCIDKVFCMHLSKQVVLFVLLVIFKSVRRYNIDLSDIILIYYRKEKKKKHLLSRTETSTSTALLLISLARVCNGKRHSHHQKCPA